MKEQLGRLCRDWNCAIHLYQKVVSVAVEDPEDVLAEHFGVTAGEELLEELVKKALGQLSVRHVLPKVLELRAHAALGEVGVLE